MECDTASKGIAARNEITKQNWIAKSQCNIPCTLLNKFETNLGLLVESILLLQLSNYLSRDVHTGRTWTLLELVCSESPSENECEWVCLANSFGGNLGYNSYRLFYYYFIVPLEVFKWCALSTLLLVPHKLINFFVC